MVYIRINISERTNRIINDIKKEYGFKNKAQVIDFVMELLEKKYLKIEKKYRVKRNRSDDHEKE
jgi:hypothetical protein